MHDLHRVRDDWRLRMSMVCRLDGVSLVQGRGLVWRHTDALPQGVDPDHEPLPVESEEFERAEHDRQDVHQLAAELLHHHVSIHPVSDCPFAVRLTQALRSKR